MPKRLGFNFSNNEDENEFFSLAIVIIVFIAVVTIITRVVLDYYPLWSESILLFIYSVQKVLL